MMVRSLICFLCSFFITSRVFLPVWITTFRVQKCTWDRWHRELNIHGSVFQSVQKLCTLMLHMHVSWLHQAAKVPSMFYIMFLRLDCLASYNTSHVKPIDAKSDRTGNNKVFVATCGSYLCVYLIAVHACCLTNTERDALKNEKLTILQIRALVKTSNFDRLSNVGFSVLSKIPRGAFPCWWFRRTWWRNLYRRLEQHFSGAEDITKGLFDWISHMFTSWSVNSWYYFPLDTRLELIAIYCDVWGVCLHEYFTSLVFVAAWDLWIIDPSIHFCCSSLGVRRACVRTDLKINGSRLYSKFSGKKHSRPDVLP